MDFFQFLKNSTTDVKTKNTRSYKKTQNQKNSHDIREEDTIHKEHKEDEEVDTQAIYKNFKKGDFVEIIGCKNSQLNIYKGYYGEITQYKNDQDYALVFLHAIQYQTIVKFNLEHIIKHENNLYS